MSAWSPEAVPQQIITSVADRNLAVEALLDAIALGHLDDQLEAILAAAHGRKRAKRGVRNARGLSRA